MRMNQAKFEAIVKLSGENRYRHFLGVVCNFEEIWGLWKDGWAIASTDAGELTFPMWPAKEFAEACSNGIWEGYEASVIPLEDMLSTLATKLKGDGILPCIFPLSSDKGVVLGMDEFLMDLTEESKKYE